jgi:hypothetical protein
MNVEKPLDELKLRNSEKEKIVPEPQDIAAHSLYERAILQYDNPVASSEKGRSEKRD